MDIDLVVDVLTDGKRTKANVARIRGILDNWTVAELIYQIREHKPVPLSEKESARLVRAFDLKVSETKQAFNANMPASIADYCADLRGLAFEVLRVIALDSKCSVAWHWDFTGTADELRAQPVQVFRNLVKRDIIRFVLVHNHPSGGLCPSPEDVQFTRLIIDGGKILKIDLLDHVIVSRNGWYSLRREGDVSFN